MDTNFMMKDHDLPNRIIELLKQHKILNGNVNLLSITTGQSVANIFSVEDKYIVKYYANLPNYDYITRMMCHKEYDFYETCSNLNIDFIPKVIFQTANENEILILMKKYSPIKNEEWTEDFQIQAVKLCAIINALDTGDFDNLFIKYKKLNDEIAKIVGYQSDGTPIFKDDYPLSLSYKNWTVLQEKYPKHLDKGILNEMYHNFNKRTSPIPETLCHGDWNPNSCLLDGDRMLICDWAEVCMGKGIDSVTWFIKSGERRGIRMNSDVLVDEYCKAMSKYAKIKIDTVDIKRHFAASEFGVAFTFGAEQLLNSDIETVLNSYSTMVNNYNLMLK